MKKVSDVYRSSYLKCEDLKGRNVNLTISNAAWREFRDGDKLEIEFEGTDRSLLLNLTNANSIAGLHGDDPGGWIGKRITLFPTVVAYQGKSVPCIRVRDRAPAAKPAKVEPADDGDPGAGDPGPALKDDGLDWVSF